jgi:hypothetical protein
MSSCHITVAVFLTQLAAQNISVRLENSTFIVTGWQANRMPADGWSSIFTVHAGAADNPPILGSYAIENGALAFHPRFPLAPGVTYRATYRPPQGPPVEAIFEAPKRAVVPATRIEHVYPSTDLLPENQLKLYVTFSAPMARGEAWRHIHLLDRNGAPVDLPFLEIDQELWDREHRRFTILFDPGRIKRGVTPRAEVGPAIQSGKRYTLVIDRDWKDARGAPLQEEFRKSFRAGTADRSALEPSHWHVVAPHAATSGALMVNFPKPLDYALLLRAIEVSSPSGPVAGEVAVVHNEAQWRFTPAQPWKAGAYQLIIDTGLEDLAGNRIGRAFDVDTFERVSERISRKSVSLSFRVR